HRHSLIFLLLFPLLSFLIFSSSVGEAFIVSQHPMNRVSASLVTEEWLDADFALTDDEPLPALDPESDKDDIEDWDIEMDLGRTGGAKALPNLPTLLVRSESASLSAHQP